MEAAYTFEAYVLINQTTWHNISEDHNHIDISVILSNCSEVNFLETYLLINVLLISIMNLVISLLLCSRQVMHRVSIKSFHDYKHYYKKTTWDTNIFFLPLLNP